MAVKKRVVYRTKKVKHHQRAKFTLPLAIVGGFVPGVLNAADAYKNWEAPGGGRGMKSALARAVYNYLGYDSWKGVMTASGLKGGAYPALAGMAVHWLASRFGLNRMIGRIGIPVLRI